MAFGLFRRAGLLPHHSNEPLKLYRLIEQKMEAQFLGMKRGLRDLLADLAAPCRWFLARRSGVRSSRRGGSGPPEGRAANMLRVCRSRGRLPVVSNDGRHFLPSEL